MVLLLAFPKSRSALRLARSFPASRPSRPSIFVRIAGPPGCTAQNMSSYVIVPWPPSSSRSFISFLQKSSTLASMRWGSSRPSWNLMPSSVSRPTMVSSVSGRNRCSAAWSSNSGRSSGVGSAPTTAAPAPSPKSATPTRS
ncbi:hypothetical protein PR202_ga25552 [Eleusine coracana subsp. coracana]|uniref:Uncharacterized protein n=1 Tax=Eleusine coracana subsp. coracana TaxID=191504 RepID=A0AAV5DBM8_ELECO|nr:hypothetical protein PR202_ga25552 [Eleusine coracana subsp. coracana]